MPFVIASTTELRSGPSNRNGEPVCRLSGKGVVRVEAEVTSKSRHSGPKIFGGGIYDTDRKRANAVCSGQ